MTVLKLFIASLKMLFRDRLTLFWGLAFPVMFVVIFGSFNLGEGPGSTRVAIVDQANTSHSRQIVEGLRQIKFFKFDDRINHESKVKSALIEGKISAAIIIPESLKALEKGDTASKPIELRVYYDRQNLIGYQIVRGVLNQFANEVNLSLMGKPKLFSLKEESLESRRIKYMDFLLPGIMGMGLMLNGISGIAVDMTRYREQRILKRIRATPLPPRVFLTSQVLSYLVLIFVQATLVIFVATFFFGATVYGSFFNLYLLTLMGTLVFLNIGFIVAGLSRTAGGASGLSQVIGMPMMFLSGAFFSTEGLPALVRSIVQFLPLTPMLKAMRAVALKDSPLIALYPELLQIAFWVGATFLIAMRIFKFRER